MSRAHDLFDAQAIRAALERNACNRLTAAKELGIHKTTRFRKIRRLGIALLARAGCGGQRRRG